MVRAHTSVGGRKLFHAQTGTAAATAADVDITCGFVPDFILAVDDVGATNPNIRIRMPGVGDGKALLITGSTGVVTIDAADAFTDLASGEGFTLHSEVQLDGEPWSVVALRYTEDLVG